MSTKTHRHPTPARQRVQPSAGHGNGHGRMQHAHPSKSAITSTTPVTPTTSLRRAAQPRVMRHYESLERQRRRRLLLKVGAAIVVGVALLGGVFVANQGTASSPKSGQAGQYRFDVADPAAGALAPDFTLPSTTGGTVHLSDFRGKNVLLYFQEGIGCETCWTQIKDIQADMKDFQSLGIATMLTVTTNPLAALKQKVADEGLTLPVLSDESFAVSRAYNATMYGMMAGSADGHTFILVGPDGRIRWRADYGGPPNYTMYVPVSNLIADIKAGTRAATNGS